MTLAASGSERLPHQKKKGEKGAEGDLLALMLGLHMQVCPHARSPTDMYAYIHIHAQRTHTYIQIHEKSSAALFCTRFMNLPLLGILMLGLGEAGDRASHTGHA